CLLRCQVASASDRPSQVGKEDRQHTVLAIGVGHELVAERVRHRALHGGELCLHACRAGARPTPGAEARGRAHLGAARRAPAHELRPACGAELRPGATVGAARLPVDGRVTLLPPVARRDHVRPTPEWTCMLMNAAQPGIRLLYIVLSSKIDRIPRGLTSRSPSVSLAPSPHPSCAVCPP